MKNLIFLTLFLILAVSLNAQNTVDINLLETTLIKPEKITKIKDGHYIIDFGKDFFGTVQLLSKNNQNEPIIFNLGEKLENPNRVSRYPGGTIRYEKVILDSLTKNRVTTIQLVANKRNTTGAAILLPSSLGVVMPFRYCEIENLQVPIKKLRFIRKDITINLMMKRELLSLQIRY